jgi:hypothetical protein
MQTYTEFQLLSILAGIYITNPEMYLSICAGEQVTSLYSRIIEQIQALQVEDIHVKVQQLIEMDRNTQFLRVRS